MPRILNQFICDLINGLVAVTGEKVALGVQHVVSQTVQKGCLSRSNIADYAYKLALFDLKADLLKDDEVLKTLECCISLRFALGEWLVQTCERW